MFPQRALASSAYCSIFVLSNAVNFNNKPSFLIVPTMRLSPVCRVWVDSVFIIVKVYSFNYSCGMKLVSSKAFRSRISEFSRLAEKETIYITRPGGRLLMLSSVPEGDRKQILRTVGVKDTLVLERRHESNHIPTEGNSDR